MDKPQIVAYLKTHCGWSDGVRAVLAKYGLPYEEKDIIKNPAFRWEMEQKSGQPLSPCIEIEGSHARRYQWRGSGTLPRQQQLWCKLDAAPSDVPLNAPCPPEQHEANVFFRR